MKKKDIQELKLKPTAELLRMVNEKNEELRVLRFDLAAGKVKDISKIYEARKTIARIETFLRQGEIAAGGVAASGKVNAARKN